MAIPVHLDACIISCRKFKQGVSTMMNVSERCWLQIKESCMIFGVQNNAHRVPVVLLLFSEGFYWYDPTPVALATTLEFDLGDLDRILELYPPTRQIRFRLAISLTYIHFHYYEDDLEFLLHLPTRRVEEPHFIPDTRPRPIRFNVSCYWLTQSLTVAWSRQERLIVGEWGPIFYAMCGTEHRRFYVNRHMVGVPDENFLRLELSLYTLLYFNLAALFTDRIVFLAQDPVADPTVPPAIALIFDNYTTLMFLLPFNSIVQPRVVANTMNGINPLFQTWNQQ